jgi:hypothetical protein
MAKNRKQARKSARRAARSASPARSAVPARRRPRSSVPQPASPELLTWAMQGLQQEIEATRNRLADLEAQARSLRSSARTQSANAADTSAPPADESDVTTSSRKGTRRRKRKLSPEARARIADAQKRRWEAYREAKKKK